MPRSWVPRVIRHLAVYLLIGAITVAGLPPTADSQDFGIQAIVGVFAGPDPFTPEVDGILWVGFMIEYEPHPIRVSITGPGTSIVLAEMTVEPQVHYTLGWNGRNQAGSIVGSGTYTVHLDILDEDADWSTSNTFSVKRRAGPAVSLSTSRARSMPVIAKVPYASGSVAARFVVTGPDPRKGGAMGTWTQLVQTVDGSNNYLAYIYSDTATSATTTVRCSYVYTYGDSLTGPPSSFVYVPPPPPPVITLGPPGEVFRPSCEVAGTVAADLDVLLYRNGEKVAELTPSGPTWSARVDLVEGYNHIVAVSRDIEGCPSSPSAPVETIYDPLGKYAGDLDPKSALATLGGLYASGYLSDPVNTSTGSFVHQATDLYLPASTPLVWSKTYNSLDPYPGPLGNGWRSNFAWEVEPEADGVLVVVRPDGRRDHYHPSEQGGFDPPLGVFDLLELVEFGYRLVATDRHVYAFGSDGRLLSLHDPSGREVGLSYEEVDGTHRLVAVRDAQGRGFDVSYDASGLVTEVLDTTGRSVTYRHDDLGNLVAATSVLGETMSYHYSERDQMTELIDPHGQVLLRNEYDDQYRVTRQHDAAGRVTAFAYDPSNRTTVVTTPDGDTIADRYDAHFRLLSRTGPDGRTVSFSYDAAGARDLITFADGLTASLAHDPSGNLTGLEDRCGLRWAFNYQGRNLTSLADPEGSLWNFSYDAQDRLVARIDPLGGATAYRYDADGNLVSVANAMGHVTTLEYGPCGELLGVRDDQGLIAAYSYGDLGLPLSVTDARGGVTRFEYDLAGRLVRLENALGEVTTFSYDWRGQVTEKGYPNGYAVSYEYNADGTLARETDSLGRTRSYDYDARGNVLLYRDALGHETFYEYNADGRMVAQTDPTGATTRFTYDVLGNITSVIGPSGYREDFAYDVMGRLVEAINPVGGKTIYQYDSRGNAVAVTDAHGLTTHTVYDALNRPVVVVLPSGAATQTTYDALGQVQRYLEEAGGEHVFTYDSRGNVLSATDPLGRATLYEYDPAGNRTAVVTALGDHWGYEYDLLGRLIAQSDPLGNTSQLTYDIRGNVMTARDALGLARTFSYDPAGLLVAETDPNGAVTSYARNAEGWVTAITDPLGATTRYDYDARGLLVSRADPLGRVTRFGYSPEGWLTRVTYPDQGVIERVYNPAGWLTSVSYPDGTSREYTYDPAGLLLSMVDALGVTTYDYDELYRPSTITGPFGDAVGYRWDAQDRLVALAYPDGRAVAYEYDIAGQLVSVTDWTGQSVAYEYDQVGRPVQVARPGGIETRYTYDQAGRMTGLEHTRADGTPIAAYAYVFDARGDITSIAELDGRLATYEYDASGRLTAALRVHDSESHSWHYTYDPAGNIVDMAELWDAAGETPAHETVVFEYDAASQLVSAVMSENGVEVRRTAYSYDGRGNLVREESLEPEDGCPSRSANSSATGGPSSGGGAGAGNPRQSTRNADRGQGGSPAPAAPGDRPGPGKGPDNPGLGQHKAVTTYSYNYDNLLVEVAQGDGTDEGISRYVRFAYDGNGNRMALEAWVEDPGNGRHLGWGKEPPGLSIAEEAIGSHRPDDHGSPPGLGTDTPGGERRGAAGELALSLRYVVDPLGRTSRVLASYDQEGLRSAYVYGLDRLAAYEADTTPDWFLADHAGSVRQIAGPGGRVLARYDYSPYGLPRGGRLEPGAWLNTGNPFGFTGAEHDPVFGLVGLGARSYSPQTARFLSGDPILTLGGVAVGGNPYAYAAGNPLRYVDTTGLIAEQLGIGSFPSQNAFLVHNILTTAGAVGGGMLVILAAPVVATVGGIIALAVGSALTVSHVVGAAEDWSAYCRGDYGSVGTNDPIYNWVGEEFGAAGTLALAIAEGVFWAKFSAVTGLTTVDASSGTLRISSEIDDVLVDATRVGSARGRAVLGHFPQYLDKADELGARRFSIPPQHWAKMPPAERWVANQRFLDRLVLRGDEVILTTPVTEVKAGSYLEREIRYLLSRGYRVVDEGWRLVPPN